MSNESSRYDGPLLSVLVSHAEQSKYKWEIVMSANDSAGRRKLGYRASGLLSDLDHPPTGYGIQVHDEERAVWTTMNPGDRKDVRNQMNRLLESVLSTLKTGST
jgi:hypothetical protein